MAIIQFVLKKFAQAVKSMYFKNVNIIGLENVPNDGPIIICGNHANQFIDPILIGSILDRELSFTIAASSFSKPVLGDMAKAAKAIPVKRPEDSKVKAQGKLTIIGAKVKGTNTKFIEQGDKVGKGWSILIGVKTIVVKTVIDDENLEIVQNQESDEIAGSEKEFFYIPKLDNSVLFKEAYKILVDDGAICIFPEGTSHDRSDFIKLKAGIAFMCLGAMSEFNCKNVKIVPVGLNYFRREEFRSDVNIEIGKPFEVPSEWATEFKVNKREVTEKLLKEVEARMKAVTLHAPSIVELKAIQIMRNIYIPDSIKLSPTQHSELCKRFIKGYEKLKDVPELQNLLKSGIKYINEIDEIGVTDEEIVNTNFNNKLMKRKFALSVIAFFLYIFFITPIFLIILPFIYQVRKTAEKERLAVIF